MVHALTLIVVLLVAAPLARFIPLAALAAILFVVAYNMSEWREVRTILRLSKADITVLRTYEGEFKLQFVFCGKNLSIFFLTAATAGSSKKPLKLALL